jgi:pilus assembly protein Flp/PilA
MTNLLRKFRRNQSGATAIEYGLIAALISVVAIATLTNVGTNLNAKLAKVEKGLE